MKQKFSDFLNLNLIDLVRGLVMTVLGAAVSTIYTALQEGGVDWDTIWKVALASGLSYLIKNFFTPVPDTVVVDSKKSDVEYK